MSNGANTSSGLSCAAAFALALGTATPARADWTAVSIHPPAAASSSVSATDGAAHGGGIHLGAEEPRAFAWLAGGGVDLHPAIASTSTVYAVAGPRQAGVARVNGAEHAFLCLGSVSTYTDLHPVGATDSAAYAASGERQGGLVRVPHAALGTVAHAALWNGTAASLVDLHPPGMHVDSCINAMGATKQAGYVDSRAALWTGNAASWIDLHPAAAVSSSALCAAESISEAVQAGFAFFPDGAHASVWHGTAASWVDLHPEGASDSYAFGTTLNMQCGYVREAGVAHASVWQGTRESRQDLHHFLPVRYGSSHAHAIAQNGNAIVVVGDAYDSQAARTEAIVWTFQEGSTPCTGDINGDRSVGLGDLSALLSAFGSVTGPPVDLSGNGTIGLEDLTILLANFGTICP